PGTDSHGCSQIAMAAPIKVHASTRRVLEVAAGLAVVGLVFTYFLPKIANYGQVWSVVSTLSWPWIVALLAASTLFILSDAPPWLAVLPGLGFLNALRMDLAGSALSQVVPGGAAVNVATQYGMLRNWGFEGRPVVLAVSLTTLWSQFATFVFPVLAIALLSLDGGHDVMLRTVALAGLVIVAMLAGALVAVLWSPRMAKRLGDKTARIATRLKAIVRRGRGQWNGDELVRFRSNTLR